MFIPHLLQVTLCQQSQFIWKFRLLKLLATERQMQITKVNQSTISLTFAIKMSIQHNCKESESLYSNQTQCEHRMIQHSCSLTCPNYPTILCSLNSKPFLTIMVQGIKRRLILSSLNWFWVPYTLLKIS